MNPLLRLFAKPKMSTAEALLALSSAVRGSDTEGIKKLIAAYPELIGTADAKGSYPLHWAAEVQSLSSVACLVDLGADTTKKDRLGYTPEDVAHWYGEFMSVVT